MNVNEYKNVATLGYMFRLCIGILITLTNDALHPRSNLLAFISIVTIGFISFIIVRWLIGVVI